MKVQRVLMPDSRAESWTVLGGDQGPVEPVERFLAYLASIERSPNTFTLEDVAEIARRGAGDPGRFE